MVFVIFIKNCVKILLKCFNHSRLSPKDIISTVFGNHTLMSTKLVRISTPMLWTSVGIISFQTKSEKNVVL